MAVQPRWRQAYGGRRYRRASQAGVDRFVGILCAVPLFLAGGIGRTAGWSRPSVFNTQIDRLSRSSRGCRSSRGRSRGMAALGGLELLPMANRPLGA